MLFDRSKTISASTALGIVTHDKHSGPKAAECTHVKPRLFVFASWKSERRVFWSLGTIEQPSGVKISGLPDKSEVKD